MKTKSVKTGTVKKKFSRFIGIPVIIVGLGLFLYPDLKTWYLDKNTSWLVSKYQEQNHPENEALDGREENLDLTSDGILQATEELLHRIRGYNDRIFKEGQAGFQDAWSVTQVPTALNALADGMFGYIEIPAMDVTLPLYVGASMEHMAKGAAVLGETSIPIGGANTNSVIAGHRGYRGAPYFRDIEKLSIGDAVQITNPWETLTYRVESIDIIDPDGSDAVKIREGKDMVTLITCHPYRSRGQYRYVVYCVRDDGKDVSNPELDESGDYIIASNGIMYGLSYNDIQIENLFRKCSAAAIICVVCLTLFVKKRRENRDKKGGIEYDL